MSTTNAYEVPISQLVIDPGLRIRVDGIEDAHVFALVEVLDKLPPITGVPRAGQIVVTDGHHTLAAHQNAGRETVDVQLERPPEDGDLYAAAFERNRLHGKALTLKDKTAFAEHLLRRHPSTSNMQVARRAGLSPTTVQSIRERLEAAKVISQTLRNLRS